MKKYEKPMLMAVSVSGNDQLCGSCADDGKDPLYKNPTGPEASLIDRVIGNKDGTLTRDEAIAAFGPGENCSKEINQYCKFTSTGITVAWS